MGKRDRIEKFANALTKELIDRGKLIEAGFAAFAHYVMPKDAPAIQVEEMRLAFMAGAEHVYSSMMSVLEEGEEPTAEDLRRMALIDKEIEEWRGRLSNRVDPPKGRA